MDTIKLSVAIITLNEQEKLPQCLQSVRDLADEVVVVDSHSSDKTVEVAKAHGAKVMERAFSNYREQKNFALDQCQYDWVLSLDADEVVSLELASEMAKVKRGGGEFVGYRFNRLTHYRGRPIYHCGWYPDCKIRLINRHKVRWSGGEIHEILAPLDKSGRIGFLSGDLWHYSYDSLADHVRQTNKFSTLAATQAFEKGVRAYPFQSLLRGVWQFFRDFGLKGGVLDGYPGLVVCMVNSLASFLKYEKIRELQLRSK